MLTGRHGIGKSQILTKYFESVGMTVKTLFLGQMSDPGDLLGLPNKDEATGKTTFMPPYWFPMDGKPIVLFAPLPDAVSHKLDHEGISSGCLCGIRKRVGIDLDEYADQIINGTQSEEEN